MLKRLFTGVHRLVVFPKCLVVFGGQLLRQERHAGSSFGMLLVWSENNLAHELVFGLLHTRSWFARPVEDRQLAHRMQELARDVHRRLDAATALHRRAQAGVVSQVFHGVWRPGSHDDCVCKLV